MTANTTPPPEKFTVPQTMAAVLLTGHGGFDKLEYHKAVPVPTPDAQQVLIRVGACGVNNTDINTRTGWYSKSVKSGTNDGGSGGFEDANNNDGSWSGEALRFPLIQGADCCGTIVAAGKDVPPQRVGERVMVRTMQDNHDNPQAFYCVTYGSELNGGFAQYALAHHQEAFSVQSDWSDVELASIPCAYSTAENMLHRLNLGKERVLITGASGGVGSAAVQLAKRRGAEVIALAGSAKHADVLALGADAVLERDENLIATLGKDSVDVVVDLVAGAAWPDLLEIMRRGGRYATAGAIAGPLVELDVRTLYLKDLTFFGCTYQDEIVFRNLIGYIEHNEIRPVIAKTYPLRDIVTAQQDFLEKKFTGKLVLIPPSTES